MKGTYDWKERVRRYKRTIEFAVAVIVVISIAASVFLGFHVISLKSKVNKLEETLVQVESKRGGIRHLYHCFCGNL